jgi:hypothetical protein
MTNQNINYEIRLFDSIVKEMYQAKREWESEVILSELALFLPQNKELK